MRGPFILSYTQRVPDNIDDARTEPFSVQSHSVSLLFVMFAHLPDCIKQFQSSAILIRGECEEFTAIP